MYEYERMSEIVNVYQNKKQLSIFLKYSKTFIF